MIWFVIRIILLISAIIPATVLFFFSFLVIFKLFEDPGDLLQLKETMMLSSSILGIIAYAGLILALIGYDDRKPKRVFWMLTCGVFSFIIFNTYGGKRAWEWVLTMNEPDEWFILVWPTFICLVYSLVIGKKLISVNESKQ